jgi:hypothetical protein
MRHVTLGTLAIAASMVPVLSFAIEINGIVAFPKKPSDQVMAVGLQDCSISCAYHTFSMISQNPTFKLLKTPGATFGAGSQLSAAAIAKSTGWVWAVGRTLDPHTSDAVALILLWNGELWKSIATSIVPQSAVASATAPTDSLLLGVDASSFDNAWAVGVSASEDVAPAAPILLHWNGVKWHLVPNPPNQGGSTSGNILTAVAVKSSDNAWAVGWYQDSPIPQRSLVLHFNGTVWSADHAVDPGKIQNVLNGVSITKVGDIVWAVGMESGVPGQLANSLTLIEGKEGAGDWKKVSSPNLFNTHGADNQLNAVSALDDKNAWAVGCAYPKSRNPIAFAQHWDGAQWSLEIVAKGCLNAVTAKSPIDVWAGGISGTGSSLIVHRDNTGWHVVPSP